MVVEAEGQTNYYYYYCCYCARGPLFAMKEGLSTWYLVCALGPSPQSQAKQAT